MLCIEAKDSWMLQIIKSMFTFFISSYGIWAWNSSFEKLFNILQFSIWFQSTFEVGYTEICSVQERSHENLWEKALLGHLKNTRLWNLFNFLNSMYLNETWTYNAKVAQSKKDTTAMKRIKYMAGFFRPI